MNDDPCRMLDKVAMSPPQVTVIIITVGYSVTDGFDVSVIGYPI
jgi:hypothetical protein